MITERYVFQLNNGDYVSNNTKDKWHTVENYQIFTCKTLEGADLFLKETIPPYLERLWKDYTYGNIKRVLVCITAEEC